MMVMMVVGVTSRCVGCVGCVLFVMARGTAHGSKRACRITVNLKYKLQ